MRVAVYRGPDHFDVEERSRPTPAAGEVLVQVSHCGVCGTDLHLFVEGMGAPDSVGGHEYSGRIAELGSEVEGWNLGERVAVDPNSPKCGRCEYCLAGRPVLCTERAPFGAGEHQGAFAEFAKVDARQLLRIPEAVSLRDAALMEPLAVALHGITQSGIQPGQRALVLGVGPIGALTVAALVARGVEDVTACEPAARRRELALKLGARRAVDPEELEEPATIFDVLEDGADAVFECSGRSSAAEQGLLQLRRRGSLVLVGTGATRPRFEAMRILLNELIITGVYNYDPDGLGEALELLEKGVLPMQDLVEAEDVPLDELLPSMQRQVAGEISGKLLVAPGLIPGATSQEET
jgi:2-desacetyl-2-hydroxyethyl bacteriochlorophyllide A dehydrogenase